MLPVDFNAIAPEMVEGAIVRGLEDVGFEVHLGGPGEASLPDGEERVLDDFFGEGACAHVAYDERVELGVVRAEDGAESTGGRAIFVGVAFSDGQRPAKRRAVQRIIECLGVRQAEFGDGPNGGHF